MSIYSILAIAFALAMDAFVVAASCGVSLNKLTLQAVLRFGIFFGLFQFAMPLIGFAGSRTFSTYVQFLGHWIAFALLLLVGGKMFLETFKNEDLPNICEYSLLPPIKKMILLALATSIDAMAVGVSFAVMDFPVLLASVIIGIVAFALSALGVCLGKKLGDTHQKLAERAGGLILIAMGIKILIEHL